MKLIAIIGAGLIGQRHVAAIEKCAAARVACIVDPSPQAHAFAARCGLPIFTSIADMLALGPLDGAIVATPNALHIRNGTELIAAGVPILIEKPIADSAPDAAALVEAAKARGIPILVGHHRRHNPIIKSAKAKLQAEGIGEIVSVHAQCWFYKPDGYFETKWRTQPGAGPIFINLIHDVDLMRHLVGEFVSVHAFTAARTRGHDVEDSAVIAARLANGSLATITVSDTIVAPWSWELTAAENPTYPVTNQSCYLIGGTRGSLEIPTGRVWSQVGAPDWSNPMDHHVETADPADPLIEQIFHFCDVIGGAEPLVSGAEAVKSLRVIEAIMRSAETGSPVHLS